MDDQEIRRPGPCYTVDTLAALRAELGAQQPLCLLMGGDAFLSLNTWHEWEKLFGLAHIVAVQRGACTSHNGRPLGNAIHDANATLRGEYHARLAPSPAGATGCARRGDCGGGYAHPGNFRYQHPQTLC